MTRLVLFCLIFFVFEVANSVEINIPKNQTNSTENEIQQNLIQPNVTVYLEKELNNSLDEVGAGDEDKNSGNEEYNSQNDEKGGENEMNTDENQEEESGDYEEEKESEDEEGEKSQVESEDNSKYFAKPPDFNFHKFDSQFKKPIHYKQNNFDQAKPNALQNSELDEKDSDFDNYLKNHPQQASKQNPVLSVWDQEEDLRLLIEKHKNKYEHKEKGLPEQQENLSLRNSVDEEDKTNLNHEQEVLLKKLQLEKEEEEEKLGPQIKSDEHETKIEDDQKKKRRNFDEIVSPLILLIKSKSKK